MRCNLLGQVGLDWHCCPVDAAYSRYDPERWHSEVVSFHTITQVYV